MVDPDLQPVVRCCLHTHSPTQIIDNGSSLTRAAFADSDSIRAIFPTLVGRPKNPGIGLMGFDVVDYFVGDEAWAKRGILKFKMPVVRGRVVNWNDMEKVWHHTFYNELRVTPEEHPVLLAEASLAPKNEREKKTSIMFETFNVPAFYLGSSAAFALCSSGRETGLVLDSGFEVSRAVPIYELREVSDCVVESEVCGSVIDSYLVELLSERELELRTPAELEIVRDIKERHCYVAHDFEEEMIRAEATGHCDEEYELPDGSKFPLQLERFRATELLFRPALVEKLRQTPPLQKAIAQSIESMDSDLRSELYENIVLCGGSTMFDGIVERLSSELALLPSEKTRIKVNAPAERKFSVSIGASVQCSMSSFDHKWVTKEEYDDAGVTIVHRKNTATMLSEFTPNSTDYVIRTIRSTEERVQYTRLAQFCFRHGSLGGYVEPECQPGSPLHPCAAIPNENILCLFCRCLPDIDDESEGEDGGSDSLPSETMICGLNHHDLILRLRNSADVPCSGIADVISTPPHRNRGHIRELFKEHFARTRGSFVMSTLFAFKYSFYERLGYAVGDETKILVCRPSDLLPVLRKGMNGVEMREVFELEEKIRIADRVYPAWLSREQMTYCLASRPRHLWEKYLNDKYFFKIVQDRRIVGYVAFRTVATREALGRQGSDFVDEERLRYRGALHVREAVWTTRESKDEIIRFLSSFRDQVSLIVWMMPEWVSVADYLCNLHHVRREGRFWSMARVVDAEALFHAMMPFKITNPLVIQISDPLCSWNHAQFWIRPGNVVEKRDFAEAVPEDEDCYRVALTIQQLAILAVGRREADELEGRYFIPETEVVEGFIPSGVQKWNQRVLALNSDWLVYCSTLAAYVFRAEDLSCTRILTGHLSSISTVVFSPTESRLLATSSSDQTIRIWNVATGRLIKIISTTGGTSGFKPLCLDWSPFDKYDLLCGGRRGKVRIYNFQKGGGKHIELDLKSGEDVILCKYSSEREERAIAILRDNSVIVFNPKFACEKGGGALAGKKIVAKKPRRKRRRWFRRKRTGGGGGDEDADADDDGDSPPDTSPPPPDKDDECGAGHIDPEAGDDDDDDAEGEGEVEDEEGGGGDEGASSSSEEDEEDEEVLSTYTDDDSGSPSATTSAAAAPGGRGGGRGQSSHPTTSAGELIMSGLTASTSVRGPAVVGGPGEGAGISLRPGASVIVRYRDPTLKNSNSVVMSTPIPHGAGSRGDGGRRKSGIVSRRFKKAISYSTTSQLVDLQMDPLSPNYFLCIFDTGAVVLFDMDAPKEYFKLREFENPSPQCTLAWIPEEPGNFLTGDFRSGVIRFWNVSQSAPTKMIKARYSCPGFRSIVIPAVSPQSSSVTASSPKMMAGCAFKDGAVGLLNLKSSKMELVTEPGHIETIFGCGFCRCDANLFATSSYDATIKLWHVPTMKCIGDLVAYRSSSSSGSSSGRSSSSSAPATGENSVIQQLDHSKPVIIYAVDWHPSQKWIAGALGNGHVLIWDAEDCCPLKHFPLHTKACYRVAWNQLEPTLLASSSKDKTCIVFRHSDGVIKKKYKHPNVVFGVDWSPHNPDLLATGCHDCSVRIYNVKSASMTPIHKLDGHSAPVFNVLFHPLLQDVLMSGANDYTSKVWNLNSEEAKTLHGHTNNVRALSWNYEIPYICLTGSWDGTIRVWDTRTEKLVKTIVDHHADVYGLSCHPDRPFLYGSTSRDTTIRFWSMMPIVQSAFATALTADGQPSLSPVLGDIEDVPEISDTDADAALTLASPASVRLYGQRSHWLARLISESSREKAIALLFDYFFIPYGSQDIFALAEAELTGSDIRGPSFVHSRHMVEMLDAEALELERLKVAPRGIGSLSKEEILRKLAGVYLRLGNMRAYCGCLVELGDWNGAIAVAPCVSLEYWTELSAQRARSLESEGSEEAAAFYFASGSTEGLLNYYVRHRDYDAGLKFAVAISRDIAGERGAGGGGGERRRNPPTRRPTTNVSDDLKRLALSQAGQLHRSSLTFPAAACFVQIGMISHAIRWLLKGNEVFHAFALAYLFGRLSENDEIHLELASVAFRDRAWEACVGFLKNVRDQGKRIRFMCQMRGLSAEDASEMMVRVGLQTPSFYRSETDGIGEDPADPIEAIRMLSLAGNHGRAASVALRHLYDFFDALTWDWEAIMKLMSSVYCIDLSGLENAKKFALLGVANFVGAQQALWKGYYGIVPFLVSNSRLMFRSSRFIIPKGYLNYFLCLAFSYTKPQQARKYVSQILATPDVPEELIIAFKRLDRRLAKSPAKYDSKGRNICVPRASSLPLRILEGGKCKSFITGLACEPPVIELSRTKFMGLGEALMWLKVNPYSPINDGSLLKLSFHEVGAVSRD